MIPHQSDFSFSASYGSLLIIIIQISAFDSLISLTIIPRCFYPVYGSPVTSKLIFKKYNYISKSHLSPEIGLHV